MNLNVDVGENKSIHIVNLDGEIDAYTAPKVKDVLLPLVNKPDQKVEVNLEKINYMDSTGLGVFIGALKAAKENNSEIRLIQPQDKVLRLFTITGLDQVFTIDTKVRGGK